MARLDSIIFDLDGTLIHSAPDIRFAANEALSSINRAPLDLPTIISFIGNGVETLVHRALNATGGADDAIERNVLATFLDVYAQNVTRLTRPYPGVLDALEHFRAQEIKLGICTNKPTEPAREICERLNIAQYFDIILGAEPERPKKPDPAALLTCCEKLGSTTDDSLYVGDSAIDFHTARNASMRFRLFADGYLNDPLPDLTEADQFDAWDDHGIVLF